MNRENRILVRVTVAVGVVSLAVFAVWTNSDLARSARRLPEALARARAAGFATTPEELSASMRIPDSENAASLYRMVLPDFRGPAINHLVFSDKTNPLSRWAGPADLAEGRKLVASFSAELAMAHQASLRPRVDFEYDWRNWLNYDVTDMRGLVTVQCLKAELAAREGRFSEAEASWLDAVRVGRHLAQMPILMYAPYLIRIQTQILWSVERMLGVAPQSPGLFATVKRVVKEVGPPPDIRKLFMGSPVQTCVDLNEYRQHKPSYFAIGAQPSYPPNLMIPLFDSATAYDAYKARIYEAAVQAKECMTGGDPFVQRAKLQALDVSLESVRPSSTWLAEVMVSGLANGVFRAQEVRAVENLVTEEIEVFREWQRTGSVPDRPPVSLLDPFSRNPLKYRRTLGGFSIWSIGADEKDDGGPDYPNFRRSVNSRDLVVDFPRMREPDWRFPEVAVKR